MISNRSINFGGSGDWCVLWFNFQEKSTYGIVVLALPYCVVDAQHCILEDAWVGTAQCLLNKASRALWSVMRVKW